MLIPDHETEVDFLNYEAISHTVVEILQASRHRALTVGIHGDWGAGKSSILKMVEGELARDKNVACLWFNGWAFEGFDDAKTVLIEATITELCRQRSKVSKVKDLGTRLLKRVDWLKVARRGSGIAVNLLAGIPSPDQIETVLTSLKSIAANAVDLEPGAIQEQLSDAASFLKPAEDGENIPEAIHAFRDDFRELLDAAEIDQLVVLIDDLDRCLPATAIETLEAIRLFLFVDKTAFVIGADETMIEYAVRQHFPDLPVASWPIPYSRSYLEKLIQIPFRIPALGAQETRTYVTLLLVQGIMGDDHAGFKTLLKKAKDGLTRPWLGSALSQSDVQEVDVDNHDMLNAAFVLAQQIGPILAEGTKGNPRQIKRFLNALLVRQVIAKARGFADLINQPVLAKLMLAERFQPDFYDHIAAQSMISAEGNVDDLRVLEAVEKTQPKEESTKSSGRKKTANTNASPSLELDKWLERDWLKRWLMIDPALSDVDIRPYVFVARDKKLLAGAVGTGGLDELIVRLCGSGLSIRSAEPEVRALSGGDVDTIFGALRERVLSVADFTTPPPGISGLAIIAKHHPRFQSEVVALLGSLDPKNLGIWIVRGWNESITGSDEREQLLSVINGWARQDDNSALQKTAKLALVAFQNEAI